MTETYETLKRAPRVGDTVRDTWDGRTYKVIGNKGRAFLLLDEEGREIRSSAPGRLYEVIVERQSDENSEKPNIDTESRIEWKDVTIQSLQAELKLANKHIDALRNDHAAAEDHYQQEIARLNGIIDTIQSYVRELEDGVK